MTTKDKIFIAKIEGAMLATFYLVMFSYYAFQPRYLWDDGLVLAADKTFWLGLVLALITWGMLEYIQRNHEKNR
jgi:hypothetical protein